MALHWKLHLRPPPLPADRWEAVRRPGRHDDESLTGTTRHWLRRLPAGRRPLQLCTQFPRVANRIAWHWRDPAEAREVLDDLLTDRRGGRSGFPRDVGAELRRLRDYLDRTGDDIDEHSRGWGALKHFWSRHRGH